MEILKFDNFELHLYSSLHSQYLGTGRRYLGDGWLGRDGLARGYMCEWIVDGLTDE